MLTPSTSDANPRPGGPPQEECGLFNSIFTPRPWETQNGELKEKFRGPIAALSLAEEVVFVLRLLQQAMVKLEDGITKLDRGGEGISSRS